MNILRIPPYLMTSLWFAENLSRDDVSSDVMQDRIHPASLCSMMHNCLSFSLMNSQPHREMVLSLFSGRYGLIMMLSSWLLLCTSVQIVLQRPISRICAEASRNAIYFTSRLGLAVVIYHAVRSYVPPILSYVLTQLTGAGPAAAEVRETQSLTTPASSLV